jgi:eukaryotic-like serine/threonine-protein kinase
MDAPIGKYEILEQLGAGGMALAYKARDTLLGRIVALKVIKRTPGSGDMAYKRFRHEARIAAGLTHPNIVTIYELGLEEGRPFIAMEYLPGQDLWDLIQDEQPLDLSRTISIALQTALALQHAHAQGVIHRDVKPQNIRILPDDAVKLMDFGIAKLSSGAETQLTREGVVIGTIAYMSPEQVQGKPLTPASDIFSFGIVLYEMVTQTKPFDGETTGALIYSILAADPPAIPSTMAPQPLRLLIERCLKKSTAERFPSFEPVVETLSRLQQQHPRKELPPGRRGRAPVPVSPSAESGQSPTGAYRRQTGDGARPQSAAAAKPGTEAPTQRAKATPAPVPAPGSPALLPAQRRKAPKRRKPKPSSRRLLLASMFVTSVLTLVASALIVAVGLGWPGSPEPEMQGPERLGSSTPVPSTDPVLPPADVQPVVLPDRPSPVDGAAVPTPFQAPSRSPTSLPTATQTPQPTSTPSGTPTQPPTATQSPQPTSTPSGTPTQPPTATQTPQPTSAPEPSKTPKPRGNWTPRSASVPSSTPRSDPSAGKSQEPAKTPTAVPTSTPQPLRVATPAVEPASKPVTPVPPETVAEARSNALRTKRIKPALKRGLLSIEVEVDDDSIATMTLHYKNSNETAYQTVLMERSKNKTYKAVLRGKDVQNDIDYYVEGTSRSGVISSAGDRNKPLRFRAPSKSPSEDVEVPVSF